MVNSSPRSQARPSHSHHLAAESPLARGSDHRAHCPRLLDLVGSLRPASGLAVLLVGWDCRRSLLAAADELRGLSWGAFLRGGSEVPGESVPEGRPAASAAPDLRP